MNKTVCYALVCVAWDTPAGRKVCGYSSHIAKFGCTRCYKEMLWRVGSTNCSGFDIENSCSYKMVDDMLKMTRISGKSTPKVIHKAQSEHGYRYSELLKPP